MQTIPKIYGLNTSSEIEDDVFAPTIFLAGCNLKCPYCMNARLVTRTGLKEISVEEVKDYVVQNQCEWVNISGGEPTINNVEQMINLLNEIKSWNCKIGISTNGGFPDTFRKIASNINYAALDIKCTRPSDYEKISVNKDAYMVNVLRTQSVLVENKINRNDFNYEIRTTLYPPFVDKDTIKEICSVLRKDDKFVLQQFRHSKFVLDELSRNFQPYNDQEVNDLLEIAKKYCDNVNIRYV